MRHLGFDLLPEALRDLENLPRAVREEAFGALFDVMRGRVQGRPLENHPNQQLEGCRKLYLGHAAWRLVYIEAPRHPDSIGERGVVLVAAGPRAGGAVYATAALRLRKFHDRTATTTRDSKVPAARLRSPLARRTAPATTTSTSAPARPSITPPTVERRPRQNH